MARRRSDRWRRRRARLRLRVAAPCARRHCRGRYARCEPIAELNCARRRIGQRSEGVGGRFAPRAAFISPRTIASAPAARSRARSASSASPAACCIRSNSAVDKVIALPPRPSENGVIVGDGLEPSASAEATGMVDGDDEDVDPRNAGGREHWLQETSLTRSSASPPWSRSRIPPPRSEPRRHADEAGAQRFSSSRQRCACRCGKATAGIVGHDLVHPGFLRTSSI